MSKTRLILILIILLAAFLRFYRLGQIPPALDVDEAPIGYNAYSILKTKRDEYGVFLPLSFRMLDDYRPPLYTYLASLGIGIFGLNEFGVRFPSALAGVLMVLVFYLLVKELNLSALIASLLLAISPWAVYFSRFASEANLGLLFILWGVFLFLRSCKNNKKFFLLLSSLSFGLSVYSYQAARFFAPLMMFVLVSLFLRPLKKNSFKILSFFLLAFFLVLPLIMLFLKDPQVYSIRFRGIGVLSDVAPREKSALRILFHEENQEKIVGLFFDNRRIFYFKEWSKFYLDYFSPVFLFLGGPNPRQHAPDIGHFYFLDILFLLTGIFWLVRDFFKNQKVFYLLFFWLVFTPIGAAFVWGGPDAGRGIFMFPALIIIISFGVDRLLKDKAFKNLPFKDFSRKKILYLFIPFLYFVSFLFYLHFYFIHLPLENSSDWHWHYKQAALESREEVKNYSKIVVSDSLGFSYISFLFYLKYDPGLYLQEGGTVSGMFNEKRNKVGKYYFCSLNYKSLANSKDVLFIARPQEFEFSKEEKLRLPIIKRIKDWQGEDLLWFVKGIVFNEEEGEEGDVCKG